ncbi:MAG: hypothetical protein KAT54_04810, partial [Candidatus Marinimicrobia bacterium]|nr:hypothetical protein [Candidatus Neomarinimicrobiota bacterium]
MKKYMLTKSIFSIVFLCSFLLLCAFADSKVAVPEYLWVEYGPPASANTWEKFTIPLTAETFNLDSETFSQSMQNIGMFRIRTEMHDGTDFGAVDNVKVGSLFFSSFSTGTENWNAMGDGTMSWQSSGGVSGGYIQISDWASGDWHWAVAPDSWQGDWSSLIGQNLEFYYKTNYPDYSSRIELYTSIMNRISLSATSTTLYPGSDTQVEVKLIPTPNQSVTVSLSSSDNSSITVPASVTFSAGQNSALITVEASADITEEKTCVITATASGYSTSRLTLTVIVSEGATLTGTVKDAITGSPIEDATVTVAGLSDQTDSEGSYTIVNVPVGTLIADFIGTPRSGDAPLTVQFNDQSSSGSQQVNASASGYIEYVNNNVVILGDQTTTLDISLSPQLSGEALRFVLNWGADPRDLDSYLKTPEIGGSNYTVYYDNTGSESDVPYATLDHDVTQGYGPETMTIHQMHPGTYYYYIHRYAGGGTVSSSSAVVQIYNANGLLRSIQVPTSGDDDYWNVCTIDGATSSVTVINQIQSSAP